MKINTPKISIVIPTYNEEDNIRACLESIFKQDYSKDKLEVIVVDDESNDDTLNIVKQFPVKLLKSGHRHGEISKMIGFRKATGEYVMYLDADNELVGDFWFEKMLKPLQENPEIVGVFTWEGARSNASALERYLSFDPLQRDSLYQYFSPSIDSVVQEQKIGYSILDYKEGKIPPAGRCMYRKAQVLKYFEAYEMFLELDFLVLLVNNKLNKFAFVPTSGLYHHHAKNLFQLLKKRKYNLKSVYLNRKKRLYSWFNLNKVSGLFKLVSWIIYANLIIPSFLVGIYKSLKYRDFAGMYEPVANLLVTDLLLFEGLKDIRSWKLLINRNE